jgi:hypothetical protein
MMLNGEATAESSVPTSCPMARSLIVEAATPAATNSRTR